MFKEVFTNSEKETFDLGRRFAEQLQGGDVIALFGDLGSGKTVFSQGLGTGLGVEKNISSPTFVIMKVYSAKLRKIEKFCHIDAYRLKSSKDLLNIGAQDYLGQTNTVSLLEWAERTTEILPSDSTKIKFEFLSFSKRKITII